MDLILGVWSLGIQAFLGARSLAEWRKQVAKNEKAALSAAERSAALVKFVAIAVVGLVAIGVVYRLAVHHA
jgi:hypothetical protein